MSDIEVRHRKGRHPLPRAWRNVWIASFLLALATGCGGGKAAKKQDDFFTSGSREADQRASQRMAKEEQLQGTGEGTGEKGAKPAKGASDPANGTTAAQVPEKLTLYDRLGAEQGLQAIVDDFITRVIQDPRVDWERKGVKRGGLFNIKNQEAPWQATPQTVGVLKKHMVQFLAVATGGPPRYDGKEMKTAHVGMKISNPEFDATIGDLKASLDKLRIPNKEQKELLAIIESTRPQIVSER